MDAARLSRARDGPSKDPRKGRGAQGTRRAQQQGGLSFGDFSLAGQRKVTRSLPSGKNKTTEQTRLRNPLGIMLRFVSHPNLRKNNHQTYEATEPRTSLLTNNLRLKNCISETAEPTPNSSSLGFAKPNQQTHQRLPLLQYTTNTQKKATRENGWRKKEFLLNQLEEVAQATVNLLMRQSCVGRSKGLFRFFHGAVVIPIG
jgi:hypothetical protein